VMVAHLMVGVVGAVWGRVGVPPAALSRTRGAAGCVSSSVSPHPPTTTEVSEPSEDDGTKIVSYGHTLLAWPAPSLFPI